MNCFSACTTWLSWPRFTSLFFKTPSTFRKPRYIKTCLISAVPSPSPGPISRALSGALKLASSPSVISPCTGCRALSLERAFSDLDYICMSSSFTNTLCAWLPRLQESPELTQYVIIYHPIYRYSEGQSDLLTRCIQD